MAFAAPFALGFLPRLPLPSVVLEIVAGIVIGPAVLDIANVDESIEVASLIGLAFLLFLAGLEIEFQELRGRLLRLVAAGLLSVLAFPLAGLTILSSAPRPAGAPAETA